MRLASIALPGSVTNLGDYAFSGCVCFTNAPIPDHVTGIGQGAFYECSGLTEAAVPDGVTAVEDYTFFHCANLATVSLSRNVTNIGFEAFDTCTALTNFLLPQNLSSFGNYAFENCSNLASVTIDANNIVFDPGSIFYNCASLTNVTLGNDVTNISSGLFITAPEMPVGWAGITQITVAPLNEAYSSVEGVLFDKGTNLLVAWPNGKAGGFTIPNGVVNIGDGAFENCAGLTSITFPDSVTNVGDYAFAWCTGLTNATIGNGIVNLGADAFVSCTNLAAVVLGAHLAGVGEETFANCYGLTRVTIPGSVTSIGYLAFAADINLTAMFFSGNAPVSVGPFAFDGCPVTAYCLPGTMGWDNFANNTGMPAVLWNPHADAASFRQDGNGFGFDIIGTEDIPIVVEAATTLACPSWVALQNCTLTNGLLQFIDSASTNYQIRFYRLRSP
jgi:hypothetical protein